MRSCICRTSIGASKRWRAISTCWGNSCGAEAPRVLKPAPQECYNSRPGGYIERFFLDTANLDELRKGASWGIVDGVTTNPTLIAKEGRPLEDQIRLICDIVDGDISAEVVATEASQMVREGRELVRL